MASDDTDWNELAKSNLGDISEIVKEDDLVFAKVLATKQAGLDETLGQLAEATLEAEAAGEAMPGIVFIASKLSSDYEVACRLRSAEKSSDAARLGNDSAVVCAYQRVERRACPFPVRQRGGQVIAERSKLL